MSKKTITFKSWLLFVCCSMLLACTTTVVQDFERTQTPLEKAVMAGDIGKIEALLAAGVDVNQINTESVMQCPPIYSVGPDNPNATIKLLLASGARLDIDCKYDDYNLLINRVESAARIMEAIESNKTTAADKAYLSALRPDGVASIQTLIDAGAVVNDHGSSGTPLGIATEYGDMELIDMLLTAGADPDYTHNKWSSDAAPTAIEIAYKGGDPLVIAKLTEAVRLSNQQVDSIKHRNFIRELDHHYVMRNKAEIQRMLAQGQNFSSWEIDRYFYQSLRIADFTSFNYFFELKETASPYVTPHDLSPIRFIEPDKRNKFIDTLLSSKLDLSGSEEMLKEQRIKESPPKDKSKGGMAQLFALAAGAALANSADLSSEQTAQFMSSYTQDVLSGSTDNLSKAQQQQAAATSSVSSSSQSTDNTPLHCRSGDICATYRFSHLADRKKYAADCNSVSSCPSGYSDKCSKTNDPVRGGKGTVNWTIYGYNGLKHDSAKYDSCE